MQTKERIGSLFMAGFDGLTAPESLKTLIKDYNLGGVILFKRNIKSHDQLKELTTELRDLAGRNLHIAVDHEGGRVFRMPEPFTQWPPMGTIGSEISRTGDFGLAYSIGKTMAQELKEVGININFAPVLDINTNPKNPVIGDRAFSEDPLLTAKAGVELIRGLQENGVNACGKHFPGHGDTYLDSHLDLPKVPHTPKRLADFELVPFKAAIESGVSSIMTAHVIYEGIDKELPATLSPRIVKELLIGDLGFKGVIFTDDLNMKAIADKWTVESAAFMSLKAGCNVVLICAGEEHKNIIESLVKKVESGVLNEQLIDNSLSRIRFLKVNSV